jgi:hypothetical protein
MSFWERVGETIGYGLAALVLGPPAAISRAERRRIRRAFVTWCDELSPVTLETGRSGIRRAIYFETAIGRLPATAELRVFALRAQVEAAIQPLPTWVAANVSRDLSMLRRVRMRWGEPLASEGSLRVDSTTLDVDSARALAARVSASKLGELRAVDVEVASERLRVTVVAMTTVEAWRAIGEGIVEVANWLVERWPVGYRG